MVRYFAFLRAINVGGHTVTMKYLRQLFEERDFFNVETFIASGNVIFDAPQQDAKVLEKTIEDHLRQSLGYDVATFIRTKHELSELANYQPFTVAEVNKAVALNVAFLKYGLDRHSEQKLASLKTDIDTFHVQGREVYWLCQKKQSESTFSNAVLEKTLGISSTLRGVNTVKNIVAKYVPKDI